MSDDLVERVARRLCNTAGSNWNAENFNQTDDGSCPEYQREYYRMLARAAIAVCMEEAAKVCISVSTDALTKVGREHEPFMRATAEDCAAAIRALVKDLSSD